MNCKRKIALVYTSITGNTEEVVKIIKSMCPQGIDIDCKRIEHFDLNSLEKYDAVLIGTYTWGDGDIPKEMEPLYLACEKLGSQDLLTGVFGTGDTFYPNFCGAVNQFRDMLYVHTKLKATLKIELAPQSSDNHRIKKFISLFF